MSGHLIMCPSCVDNLSRECIIASSHAFKRMEVRQPAGSAQAWARTLGPEKILLVAAPGLHQLVTGPPLINGS